MSEIDKANKLQDEANKLQNTANELQQRMINEIKTNNEVTSKHNRAIRLLTLAIVVLSIFTIWANYNKTRRYAVTSADSNSVYVLDTKTSRVWLRSAAGNIDLGTNENPKRETNFLP